MPNDAIKCQTKKNMTVICRQDLFLHEIDRQEMRGDKQPVLYEVA